MAKFESEGARLRDLREVLCPRSAFVRSGPWPEESRSLRLRTDLDRERRATECPRFPLEEGSALLLLLLLLLELPLGSWEVGRDFRESSEASRLLEDFRDDRESMDSLRTKDLLLRDCSLGGASCVPEPLILVRRRRDMLRDRVGSLLGGVVLPPGSLLML